MLKLRHMNTHYILLRADINQKTDGRACVLASSFLRRLLSVFVLSLSVWSLNYCYADNASEKFIEFDDTPLSEDIILPDWFKLSFLEIDTDLKETVKNNKKGLILYFGQKDCAYCKAHLSKNWGDRGIVTYTRKYFDVVAIDVRGDQAVIGVDGERYYSEKTYSAELKTNFTPTLLFYDLKGVEVLRLSGYHPPYQFRAALEYVADKHYLKERFREYLARGERLAGFEESELNDNAAFSPPPYALDRSKFPGQSPLAVFFEAETCHACDVLHNSVLKNPGINEQLQKLEIVQLDLHSETPVLTPQGVPLSARQWADQLGIYYSPTIVFFDVNGREVLRIDSVVRLYRLNNVLNYILTEGYREYQNFQQWRQAKSR